MNIQLNEEQKSVFNRVVEASFYANQDLMHSTFQRMREEAPICWLEPDNYRPFWAVTRYDDMKEVLRNSDVFLNAPRRQLFNIPTEQGMIERSGNEYGLALRTLTDMDEPDHSIYRNVTKDWFSQKSVGELEGKVRAIAIEFADKMVDLGGKCDFVNDVALWYPLRVIMSVMGVPREDEERMLKWTMELFGFEDEDLSRDKGEPGIGEAKSAQATLNDFFAYFTAITKDRQENPRDDLCSLLANARIDDKLMPTLELMSYYVIVATAGHDTTSSSTSAGMLALIENPGELEKLQSGSQYTDSFVNETIRRASPVRHFCRTANKDYVLNGVEIKKGESVVVFHPSANNDESLFECPHQFQIDRRRNWHMAFGYGIHVCIGQHLARLEIGMLFEEILKRVDNIELAGKPKWASNSFIGGLKSLPITYSIKS
jgi:cytochrome P450